VKVKAVSLEVGADFSRDVKPADRKSTLGYGMSVRAVLAEKVAHFAPFLVRSALKWSTWTTTLSAGYDEDNAGRISDTQVPVDLNGPLTVSILLGQ
jgi:hypothetical protein